MTIVFTDLDRDHADDGDDDRAPRPCSAFCPVPSPLSEDLDEIYAYMLLIGDRRGARPPSRG